MRRDGLRTAQARLDEAVALAEALDLRVADSLIAPLRSPTPATLIGAGKVTEIGRLVEALSLDVVVIDDALSPVQQRNLERAWKVKVIDRTGLILEIFARRARTREGRLQVELARPGQSLRMPPFIETDREVTDDPAYTNAAIAARSPP